MIDGHADSLRLKAYEFVPKSLRLIIFILAGTMPYSVLAGSNVGFAIRSEGIRYPDGRPELALAVWNCGIKPVETDVASLPWGENTLGLTIRRIGLMPTAELKQSYRINDLPVRMIRIEPMTAVRGAVDLSERFALLKSGAKSDDFIVFWTYNTGLLNESPAQQIVGTELILRSPQPMLPSRKPCE